MSLQLQSIVLIIVALALANLPWFSSRFLCCWSLSRGMKPLWMRILEWFLYYLLVALLSVYIEIQSLGEVYDKGWEFYCVVSFMYLILAFPGICYRHLYRREE